MGKGAATPWLSSYYSSKQNNGKKGPLSPTLSIITRWHEHGRTSHSISYICVGGEADLQPWLVPRKNPPKKANTWWIFKLWKLVSCHFIRQGVNTHNELPFLRRKVKTRNLGYERNPNSKITQRRESWEKRKSFSFERTSTLKYGEPHLTNTQTKDLSMRKETIINLGLTWNKTCIHLPTRYGNPITRGKREEN